MSEGLAALNLGLTPLKVFAMDAGSDAGMKNEYVYVPLATARTGGAYSSTYESGNTTITGYGVQLSNHRMCSWHVTEEEQAKSSNNLFETASVECAYGLAADIQTLVLNVISTSNFTGTSVTVSSSSFDTDSVADLTNVAKKTNKWRELAPGKLGSLVLDGAYVNALRKDLTITDMSASGKDTLITGSIGRLFGLDIYENNLITSTTPGTTSNLVGFACQPGAIAVAIRPIEPLMAGEYGFADIATDPDTGISMAYRRWVNTGTGAMWGTYTVLAGMAKVDLSRLIAIYSA